MRHTMYYWLEEYGPGEVETPDGILEVNEFIDKYEEYLDDEFEMDEEHNLFRVRTVGPEDVVDHTPWFRFID